MSFNEPSSFGVDVLQSDINSATAGASINSLSQALIRLNNAKQLPGQINDTNPQAGCLFNAQIAPVLTINGVSLASVFVCSFLYGTDVPASVIIAAENLGVKPTAPYTVTLTKTN